MNNAHLRRLRARLAGFTLLICLASITPAHGTDAIDLDRFRGRIVVVDFWASWCAPCRRSFPWLNELQARYRDRGLVIIGVNVDRDRVDAENFLRDTPARFEIVYDPRGALAAKYELPGMPTSLVFGPTGELIARHVGFRDSMREERERELKDLLVADAAAHEGRPPLSHQTSESHP